MPIKLWLAEDRQGCRSGIRGAAARGRGEACSCRPAYQAQVWSALDRKPIRKTFPTLAEALAWRQEAQVALRRRTMRAPTATTLAEAAEDWLAQAEAGIIRTRSGDPYKPSALRTHRHALEGKLLPRLGNRRLSAISRNDLQDLVDRFVADGQAPSTVRNAILPLRAIYRRSVDRGTVALNPTRKLQLPAVRGKPERTARADEAADLLNALPLSERALWATALYAGLRRGELQALHWTDLDLERNLIHVHQAWDRKAGLIQPKSRAGTRQVPIPTTLRKDLLNHQLLHGRPTEGFVFPNKHARPFDPASPVRAKPGKPPDSSRSRSTSAATPTPRT